MDETVRLSSDTGHSANWKGFETADSSKIVGHTLPFTCLNETFGPLSSTLLLLSSRKASRDAGLMWSAKERGLISLLWWPCRKLTWQHLPLLLLPTVNSRGHISCLPSQPMKVCFATSTVPALLLRVRSVFRCNVPPNTRVGNQDQ